MNRDHADLASNSSDAIANPKRKRFTDSFQEEPAKRQNSRPSIDQSFQNRNKVDDMSASDRPRQDRSRSRERCSSSPRRDRNRRFYSPERSSSQGKYRSPNDRCSSDRDRDRREPERELGRQSVSNGGHTDARGRISSNVDDLAREERTRAAAEYKQQRLDRESRRSDNTNIHIGIHKSSLDAQASTLPKDGSDPGTRDSICELITALSQFGDCITDVASLKLQKDTSQKALDRRRSEHEKARGHFAEFPAAAEAQNAALQRAQKEMDEIDQRLLQKQAGVSEIVQLIACRVIPSDQRTQNQSYGDLKERVDSIANRQISFTSRLASLSEMVDGGHKKWSEAKTVWDMMENNETQLFKKFDELTGLIDQFHTSAKSVDKELADIRNKISAVEIKIQEERDVKDPNAIKAKLENLSSRQDDCRAHLMALSKGQDDIKARSDTLANKSSDIERLEKSVFGGGKERSLLDYIQALEKNEEVFRKALEQVQAYVEANTIETRGELTACTEGVRSIANRLDTLGARPSLNSADEAALSSAAFKDLEDKHRSLEESQDQVGQGLDEVNKKVREVSKEHEEVKRELIELAKFQNEMKTKTQEMKIDLDSQNQQTEVFRQEILNIRGNTLQQGAPNSPQLSQNVARVDNMLSSLQHEVHKSVTELQNAVEGLKLGYTNVESRMNNVSTETLAAQILGQMEYVYPIGSLRNAEASIVLLRETANLQGSYIRRADTRLDALEAQPREGLTQRAFDDLAATVQSIQADFETSKDKFDGYLRNMQTIDSRLDALEVHAEPLISKEGRPGNSFNDLSGAVQTVQTGLENLKEQSSKSLQNTKNSLDYMNESLKNMANELAKPLLDIEELRVDIEEMRAAIETHGDHLDRLRPDVRKLQENDNLRKVAFDNMSTNLEDVREALESRSANVNTGRPKAGTKRNSGGAPNGHKRRKKGPFISDESDDDYQDAQD